MKRFLMCMVMALTLWGWLPGAAWAASLPADEVVIYFDGQQQDFTGWLHGDTTFLPLRAVGELFDFEVHYDEPMNMVQLFDGRNYCRFYLSQGVVSYNGVEVEPPAAGPLEREGRIWLPLRYMAKLLDMQIDWNEQSQRVELADPAMRVRLPEGTSAVGEREYYGLKLLEIDLLGAEDSLRKIGAEAFAGTRLREITIPDGVEEIGPEAFAGCSQLWEVKLPASLRAIEDETFNETGLSRLLVPDKVERIGAHIFNLYQRDEAKHYTPIVWVILPPSVQQIDPAAFANCPDLLLMGLAGSYAEEYAKAQGLQFAAITEEDLAGYYQEAAGGSWLTDKQRDSIVQEMKNIANLSANEVKHMGAPEEPINPAKLQVARPVRAYYYNGTDFEQEYLLYPLVYQDKVQYLISAQRSPGRADLIYSLERKAYTADIIKALNGHSSIAIVYDANCTYIYDGHKWQLIHEFKDVHLRNEDGPHLDTEAKIDNSGLLFTMIEDLVDVEDAYLGRLPRVAPAAD